jgi:DNA mismatch endonuclease (patch repair protein)
MSLIRGHNTSAEKLVQKIVGELGFKPKTNVESLPGKPDLVLEKQRKVIFVNGCFWHRHPSIRCRLARWPKSKLRFWRPKLLGNRQRDLRNVARLRRAGWKIAIVWECQLGDTPRVREKLNRFLEDSQ